VFVRWLTDESKELIVISFSRFQWNSGLERGSGIKNSKSLLTSRGRARRLDNKKSLPEMIIVLLSASH
jgi:hypothetical protein